MRSFGQHDVRKVIDHGPRALWIGPTRDKPFLAEFEEVRVNKEKGRPDSREVIQGRIYRDRQGRTRTDFRIETAPGETTETAAIYDPLSGSMFVLDLASQIFTKADLRSALQSESEAGQWVFSAGASSRIEETSDRKEIEGILCRRIRLKYLKQEQEGEVWVADELSQVVLEKFLSPNEDYTWRLFNIHRIEPASSLFVTPPDFTEIDQTTSEQAAP